jgi:flagellar biogenesis protein FliO
LGHEASRQTIRHDVRGSGYIKIVDRANLGPDRTLYIIEAAGKTLLLGITAQKIERLAQLDAGRLVQSHEQAGGEPILEMFSQLLRKAQKDFSAKRRIIR